MPETLTIDVRDQGAFAPSGGAGGLAANRNEFLALIRESNEQVYREVRRLAQALPFTPSTNPLM